MRRCIPCSCTTLCSVWVYGRSRRGRRAVQPDPPWWRPPHQMKLCPCEPRQFLDKKQLRPALATALITRCSSNGRMNSRQTLRARFTTNSQTCAIDIPLGVRSHGAQIAPIWTPHRSDYVCCTLPDQTPAIARRLRSSRHRPTYGTSPRVIATGSSHAEIFHQRLFIDGGRARLNFVVTVGLKGRLGKDLPAQLQG